jgi:hypothetical protein
MLVFDSNFPGFDSVKTLSINLSFLAVLAIGLVSGSAFGQQPPVKAQEISEEDGLPVLLKHLPEYEGGVKGAGRRRPYPRIA